MPLSRLALLTAALLFGLAPEAAAQGFSAFNNRNHPELDWQVAETAHFRIAYPQRLAGIEAEAASIAEASYDALAANLGVTFDEKIRLYLSDEDEIANGFAVPFGGGYTNIWVHVNAFATTWTGREKWLRKVIAHELAHIFHYRAVSTGTRPFPIVNAGRIPRFWTEGLAQYETEAWDAQRGDRWLRAAVLGDALSYEDGRSIWNGRLLYAVGNSQVRFLAEQRGDTTLAQILAHRDTSLFGLVRTHSFESALEAVTGQSYRAFYDDWRRHVNVYYNTLAGQLEPVDSLRAEPLPAPGRYLYDAKANPADTAQMVVLALQSPARPVRQLYVVDRAEKKTHAVAEGLITAPVAWRPDGEQIAFARTSRGRNGSLLNDLFVVNADGSGLRPLTESRRASSPAFAPDGRRLAFVGVEDGTANLFVLNLESGEEQQITQYTGDVQISAVRWAPQSDRLAFARFAADGTRALVVLDLATGAAQTISGGFVDDRLPLWRPDGRALAFTSLRDDVPNIFVHNLATDSTRRVTHLALGALALDWLPPDSAHAEGRLAMAVTVSKERDELFLINAARTTPELAVDIPAPYTGWTTHRPPQQVPSSLPPDEGLVTQRTAYSSWDNITHVASAAVPYYFGPESAGLAGFTAWTEPLGKHTLFAGATLSLGDPGDGSSFFGSYVNRQLRPTLTLSGYRFPGQAQAYGTDVLVEDFIGGDLAASWPIDRWDRPYTATRFDARLRYAHIQPLNLGEFAPPLVDDLQTPEAGEQADLRLTLSRKTQRPYRGNFIHPLDGRGVRARVTAAAPVLGADASFLRGDLAAYTILPSIGLHRLFLYGRAQAQTGTPLPQDYLGLSRYDAVQLAIPGVLPVVLGDAERVRGFRSYAVGSRLLFGTAEYRVPLLPSLRTEILGVLSLGATTAAAFVDGGAVWNGARPVARRVGLGGEIKNALSLFGFRLTHALGLAQPAPEIGTPDEAKIYYRIRAAVPL